MPQFQVVAREGSSGAHAESRVVTIAGRIDAVKVLEFEERVAVGGRRIVLDLSDATEVPVRAERLLRGALRRTVRGGASLAVIGAAPHIQIIIDRCLEGRVEFVP